MNLAQLYVRSCGRCLRLLASLLFRRAIELRNRVPYISFTFDDFPRSALHAGSNILSQFNLRATYYASLGLMGTEAPTGMIFTLDDLKSLITQGHELGCHTFDHCHSWKTRPRAFEDSIVKNKLMLAKLLPEASFRSFSYPLVGPRPLTKRRVSRHFRCCRDGGQIYNSGTTDLNLLKSYFLEHSRGRPDLVAEVIERNRRGLGWLIFTTHDISETPTIYGCTPSYFEKVVRWSVDSGAKILPVGEALQAVCNDASDERSKEVGWISHQCPSRSLEQE